MKRTENVELTVLCLIYKENKYLLQNRVKEDWKGYTLPGGHIEKGESVADAVVREVKEETGLTIYNPKLCGLKEFPIENGRYIVFLFNQCGERYHGTLGLLGNLLSLGDLWDAVRVRGGAYGAEMQAERDGSLLCTSYRDPGPARTLGVYRGMADWIEAFCGSGEALDPFLAGAVARTEPLISPREQGARADALWFAGLGREALLRARRELLGAAPEDLLRWRGLLRAMARDAAVCVVGPGEALDACRAEQLTVVAL